MICSVAAIAVRLNATEDPSHVGLSYTVVCKNSSEVELLRNLALQTIDLDNQRDGTK